MKLPIYRLLCHPSGAHLLCRFVVQLPLHPLILVPPTPRVATLTSTSSTTGNVSCKLICHLGYFPSWGSSHGDIRLDPAPDRVLPELNPPRHLLTWKNILSGARELISRVGYIRSAWSKLRGLGRTKTVHSKWEDVTFPSPTKIWPHYASPRLSEPFRKTPP